jgi:hypothetical protein
METMYIPCWIKEIRFERTGRDRVRRAKQKPFANLELEATGKAMQRAFPEKGSSSIQEKHLLKTLPFLPAPW